MRRGGPLRALAAACLGAVAVVLLARTASRSLAEGAGRALQLLQKHNALSYAERTAMKQSKLKARLAAHTADMDAKIEAFKTAVSPSPPSSSAGGAGGGGRHFSNLVGQYVMHCEDGGKDCEKGYEQEDWAKYKATPHTVQAVDGLGVPIGEPEDVPIDYIQPSQTDVMPKFNNIGANWLGGSDRFVPMEDSGISAKRVLPVWKRREMREEEEKAEAAADAKLPMRPMSEQARMRCPGDPTGRDCFTGADGSEGVYEATFFSDGADGKDDTARKLERQGVNVGEWTQGEDPHVRHNWNRAGVDHPYAPIKDPKWSNLQRPQWAYDNSAMKSLGWNPEGTKNKQLMLGTVGKGLEKDFGDTYLDKNDYSRQVETEQDEQPRDDHFANWEPKSRKNIDLLYGTDKIIRGKRWSPEAKKWVKDDWTMFQHIENSTEAYEHLRGPSGQVRQGEPFSDAASGAGWGGSNMVNTNHNNLNARKGKPYVRKVPKLEKMGVNI